jgi:predicted N-formylglutamate amidohydrolase
MQNTDRLLDVDEPPAWHVENTAGTSQCVIICDHASARIPRSLGTLGLTALDLQRHIAWDIGAAGVAAALGKALDAFVIVQNYSRLVIDCNRPTASPGSIVTMSEDTRIPGNESLSAVDATRREREIFQPYHQRIQDELEARRAQGRPSWLISMHSFTPVFRGSVRRWHAGVLYRKDPRLAQALLQGLRAVDGSLILGDNEPYAVSDATDYAIPVYGEAMQLPHVGIEIRQDLIGTDTAQQHWAQRIAAILRTLTRQCTQWL